MRAIVIRFVINPFDRSFRSFFAHCAFSGDGLPPALLLLGALLHVPADDVPGLHHLRVEAPVPRPRRGLARVPSGKAALCALRLQLCVGVDPLAATKARQAKSLHPQT